MKCFYHSADLDGHCSGALVKIAYPNCELIGINYGDDFPWSDINADEMVFMVDFSLQPFENMVRLHSISGSHFTWLDHHKSAIEEENEHYFEEDSIPGIRKIGIGACRLVWDHLWQESKGRCVPTFIKLLSEYDVWNHADPRTLPFQYGMRQYDTIPESNMDFWKELFDAERVQQITEEGALILKYQNKQNEIYASSCSFETEVDGLKCIAINRMITNSQMFDSIWDNKKYDAMLTFGWRKGSWTVSLYSDRDDIDVSAVAKSHGGGGHKGAAGFQCQELPFDLK